MSFFLEVPFWVWRQYWIDRLLQRKCWRIKQAKSAFGAERGGWETYNRVKQRTQLGWVNYGKDIEYKHQLAQSYYRAKEFVLWTEQPPGDNPDLTAARGEIARLRVALQAVQHNRDCSCYDARHGLPLGPCPRCVVGYDEVDAALAAKGGA